MTGGAAADQFNIDAGNDTITDFGFGGVDTVVITAGATLAAAVTVDYTAGAATDIDNQAALADAVFTVANDIDFDASNATDTTNGIHITAAGNAAASVLTGTDQADSITGGTNADTLVGDAGNDTITGGAANDTVTGGTGVDRFNVDAGTDTVTDLGDGGADVLVVSAGATANATVAAAYTATAATTNGGTALTGAVLTAAGNNVDLTAVNTGNGFTITNNGNATGVALLGTTSGDSIVGGTGADTITGGAGSDVMDGGAGLNTFGTANNFGAVGTSTVASATALTGAGIANGDTWTFNTSGNGDDVDTISNFTNATGQFDVVTAGAPTTLFGNAGGALTAGTTYIIYGDYAANVFTVDNGGAWEDANSDALIVVGDGNLTAANTTGFQLVTNLAAAIGNANFV